jgi:G3E family GTPase
VDAFLKTTKLNHTINRIENPKMKKIPVTILSGFQGAGKTTILNHILNNRENMKIVVIVNDMSEVNPASQSVEKGSTSSKVKEKLAQISNDRIRYTLREDLVKEVTRLTENGGFDYLLIKGSGISEPLPIAQSLSYNVDKLKTDLTKIIQIDTMVTVVDALNFEKDFMSVDSVTDRKMRDGDKRNIVDLLTNQIEFANVIIINKTDQSSPYKLEQIKRLIAKLNPGARIITTSDGQIEPGEILNTGLFDLVKTSQGAGWLKELTNKQIPEMDEYGIGSFVYRSRKPFNMERLEDFINNKWQKGILRSKGFFWIASQPNDALVWTQAGQLSSIKKTGRWWASFPLKERNQHPTFQTNEEIIMANWDKQFGDRHIELVFIGQNMPEQKIREELDNCLCTDSELIEYSVKEKP